MNANYHQQFNKQNNRSLSPIQPEDENIPQTFVFSHLPLEEKKRFMDFLIDN